MTSNEVVNKHKAQKISIIALKFKSLCLLLNEHTTRLWYTTEANAYGRGF